MPPQLTTMSHSITPLSVSTDLTRPSLVFIAKTRVNVCIAIPALRAPAAIERANWEGSTCPSVVMMQAPTTPSKFM